MSRPGTVTVAFILWIIAAIASFVGAVIEFVALTGAGAATGGAGIVLVIAGIVALIIGIIELVVVFKMRSGHNWARIVLTIVGILNILGNLSNGIRGQGFSWVTLILTLLAVILMYVGGANAFFRRR